MANAWSTYEKAQALIDSGKEANVKRGWALMEQAVTQAQRDPNDDYSQRPILLNALETDFKRGFALAKRYADEDTSRRLEYYRDLLKYLKAPAVPLVVDGLCLPWNSEILFDGVTHARYVRRIAQLLSKFDVSPHLERIASAFRKVKDRTVHDALRELPGYAAFAPAPPKVSFQLPAKRLAIDVYAAGVAAAVGAALKSSGLKPRALSIGPEALALHLGVVNDEHELELDAPRFPRGNPFPALLRRHGFDPRGEDAPEFGDSHKLPECAVYLELFEQLGRVAPKARLEIAGVGKRDEPFERLLRTAISFAADLPDDVLLRELAAVLYERPARRKTFVEWARKGSRR